MCEADCVKNAQRQKILQANCWMCEQKCINSARYYKKSKTEGIVANKQRTGRPNKLSARERKIILREIKKDPKISTPQLALMIND